MSSSILSAMIIKIQNYLWQKLVV